MLKRNIFAILFCSLVLPAFVLLMQNCAKSESTSAAVAAPADCTYELACADPSGTNGSEICISGRVVDGFDRTANLSPAALSAIEVRLYEPLAFFTNPTATAPFKTLTALAGNIDSCGRFTTRLNVASDTPLGSVGVVTTDLSGAGANYILSAVVRQVSSYKNLVGLRTFLVSKAQDQTWSTSAGLSGTTFATAGAISIRYYQGGNTTDPVPGNGISGITPTRNGSPNATIDFFFSDSTLKTMQTIAPAQIVTGANGVAFIQPGSGFSTMSAGTTCTKLDGTPGTLTAGSASLASAAGVILFHDLEVTCF